MIAELLIFEVAGAKLSVPLERVEEVVPMTQITAIPNSPPFLMGLTAIRGKVMSVIDAGKRYGIGPSLNSHLMVCQVRGSMTAIAIDQPLVAGAMPLRELSAAELRATKEEGQVHEKFIRGGFELLEASDQGPRRTGLHFLAVDPDLFVSTEMASKVAEV